MTLLTSLAGCGGGGGTSVAGAFIDVSKTSSTAATASAEGFYAGTASNGRPFNALILENNAYYIIYGSLAGEALAVAGLISGTGQASNGNFTSGDLREYPSLGLPVLGTLSGSYFPATFFNAVVTTRGTAVTYSGVAPAGQSYVYDTRARLADIAGTWSMQLGTGAPVSLTISTSGTYTGSLIGCTLNGTITPRASGKNVFDVTLRFGPGPCAFADLSATGHAVSYLNNNGQRQLTIVGSDLTRTVATVLTGVR